MDRSESKEVVKLTASFFLFLGLTIAVTVFAGAWPYVHPEEATPEGVVFGTVLLTVFVSLMWFGTGSMARDLSDKYI